MQELLMTVGFIVLQSLALLVAVLVSVAYIVYADRKIWAAVQMRRGPNVVGPWGLFQSFADMLKFVFKEVGHTRWRQQGRVPDRTAGDLHSRAQRVGGDAGECRLGDCRHQRRHPVPVRHFIAWRLRRDHGRLGVQLQVSVPRRAALGRADGFLRGLHRLCHRHRADVRGHAEPVRHRTSQSTGIGTWLGLPGSFLDWYWLPLLPMFVIFFISALAETNRPPFDLPEAESELVAGFMVEYSSTPYMLFMLGEYVSITLMCAMTTILFLGGWLPPFDFAPFTWVPGVFWFLGKTLLVFFMFAMVKAFVPRYRYDQLMRLGWKVFLPISLAWVAITAGVITAFGLAP
jgi:NADH-quinone oxidoreductase subunit H